MNSEKKVRYLTGQMIQGALALCFLVYVSFVFLGEFAALCVGVAFLLTWGIFALAAKRKQYITEVIPFDEFITGWKYDTSIEDAVKRFIVTVKEYDRHHWMTLKLPLIMHEGAICASMSFILLQLDEDDIDEEILKERYNGIMSLYGETYNHNFWGSTQEEPEQLTPSEYFSIIEKYLLVNKLPLLKQCNILGVNEVTLRIHHKLVTKKLVN